MSSKVFIDLSDLLNSEDLPFPEIRDQVVSRINESDWFQRDGETRLGLLLDQLAKTEDEGDFEKVFSEVYDLSEAENVHLQVDDDDPGVDDAEDDDQDLDEDDYFDEDPETNGDDN